MALPQRYVLLTTGGYFNGFFSSDVSRNIPAEATPLTEEQYQQWRDGYTAQPLQYHKMVNGVVVPCTVEDMKSNVIGPS